MPKFKIPVSWMMSATVIVEAENLEDAVNKAEDGLLPMEDAEYCDGSFEVEHALLVDKENGFGEQK